MIRIDENTTFLYTNDAQWFSHNIPDLESEKVFQIGLLGVSVDFYIFFISFKLNF